MKFKITRNVHVPAFTAEERANGLYSKLQKMKGLVEHPARARLPGRIVFDAVQSVAYLRRIAERLELDGRPAYFNMMVATGEGLAPALRMEPRLMPAIKAMGEPDSGNVMSDAEWLRERGLRFAYNESLLLAVPLLGAARKFRFENGDAYVMPGSMLVTRILVLNFSPELFGMVIKREARALAEETGIPEGTARKSIMEWWKIRKDEGRQML